MRLGGRRRGEQGRQGQDSSLRAGSDAIVVGIGYLASFAYPLVSLPLLSRVLGAHDLGRLLFALALVQLIVPLSDFGFGRSALRRIAVARTVEERSRVVPLGFSPRARPTRYRVRGTIWRIGVLVMTSNPTSASSR